MEMDKKAVEALTSFGLTEYEAKVYLTLVLKGVQKASALADMSDIPRPHVYSVIKLLHEKGLIIIIPEKVTKYQALPLDAVLNKLLEERMDSITFAGDHRQRAGVHGQREGHDAPRS